MRTLLATALLAVWLAAPAHAQFGNNLAGDNPANKDPLIQKYEREEKEQKEAEKAYNDQMKRLKAQKPANESLDPWRGVRTGSER